MQTILFDLDGTITQPASGIINSFIHALTKLQQPVPAKESLGWIIGPALRESFAKLIDDKKDVETAIGYYREFYTERGIFDAHVFEGIPHVLGTLHHNGHRLFVCTAKPRPFAIRVLEHFRLDHFFEEVYGPDFDGHMDNKADLLEKLLYDNTLAPERCCLIGDRLYDAKAALHNNVTPIGALWGFGSKQELQEAGVALLCSDPTEIPAAIALLSTPDPAVAYPR